MNIVLIVLIIILLGIVISLSIFLFYYNNRFIQNYETKKKYEYYLNELKKLQQNKNENYNKIVYPILYINLDRSIDRKEKLIEQFKKFNITNYKRIKGVDGKELKDLKKGSTDEIYYENEFNITKNEFNITKSELGCTLSHLKAIKYAYDHQLDKVIIIEDDISFELMPLWENTIPELIHEIKNWDIIKLHSVKYIENIDKKHLTLPFGKYKNYNWGTKVYIINKNGMENILNNYYKNNKFILKPIADNREGVADSLIFNNCITKILTKNLFFLDFYRVSLIHHTHDNDKIDNSIKIIKKDYLQKYYLVIGTIFKNEGMILKEWIKHYIYHGVEHFYMVNDNSIDNYLEILNPYIKLGIVTLYNNFEKQKDNNQIYLYKKYILPNIKKSQWFIVADLDEYLYSPYEINLQSILKNYEKYKLIIVNWLWFGTNNNIQQPKSIIASCTKRAEVNTTTKLGGTIGNKGILNSDFEFNEIKVHWENEYKNSINLSWMNPRENKLLMNHYSLISKEYYEKIKMVRGDLCNKKNHRDKNFFNIWDINDITDTRLLEQNKYILNSYI